MDLQDDRRPTVNELANQKYVYQKINGWKIYHLATGMDDIVDMEVMTASIKGSFVRKEIKMYGGDGGEVISRFLNKRKKKLQRERLGRTENVEIRIE